MGAVYKALCVPSYAASLACAALDFVLPDKTDLMISVRKINPLSSSLLAAPPHCPSCRSLLLPFYCFSPQNWGQVCLCHKDLGAHL